jgi:LysM repeat protein
MATKAKKENKENAAKSPNDITIKETEADIVLSAGFVENPDDLKNEVKKEAEKGDLLSRFLIPLITFIVIGVLVAGATWYYARPEVQNKSNQNKIEKTPTIDEEKAPVENKTPETQTNTNQNTSTETPVKPAATQATYTVKEGDTLGAIATQFGVSASSIMSLNGITNEKSLQIGQVLKIPSK